MCTVVFIPNKNKYFFASLRDENPLRARALAPAINTTDSVQYLAPIDALAGGTWIGANQLGNIIILLNGGFENHERKTSYKKSRGLIVKELMGCKNPVEDWSLMNLTNIEPFTLVIWSQAKLYQLVWDGENKSQTELNTDSPHIFSSSTLYDQVAKTNRKTLFENWIINEPQIDKSSVLAFFNAIIDKENGFIINRAPNLKTISYSFIELENGKEVSFNYSDFIDNSSSFSRIEIN